VEAELQEKGLPEHALHLIRAYVELSAQPADDRLQAVLELLKYHPAAEEAVKDVSFVIEQLKGTASAWASVDVDFTLARGLDYYTGLILEVKSLETDMGSLGGGGRYDNLTGLFGLSGVPGVGISFGVERIYDVMESLQRFPASTGMSTQVLWLRMDDGLLAQVLQYAMELRQDGIATEVYPDAVKMDKQLKYADKKGIPLVLMMGSREYARQMVAMKDFRSGVQTEVPLDRLKETIRLQLAVR